MSMSSPCFLSSSSPPPLPSTKLHHFFTGVWLLTGGDQVHHHLDVRPHCSAVSKPRTQGYHDVLRPGLTVIKWPEIVEENVVDFEALNKISVSKEIKKRVDSIKSMLDSMEDGEISISAYDTAWVALVEAINFNHDNNNNNNNNGSIRKPQFPSSLCWISENQLHDGSWGDNEIFSAHDRIINTLACVVALKWWNVHPEKCERGLLFLKENLSKLEDENAEHMPIGFEVAFPSLLEMARKLDIEFPDDYHILRNIYAMRDLKLSKIPKEIMHKVPTTLLHSLEGMEGLDWQDLLKLQSPDGSFLFSPSSTAFALMKTRDPNCFNYLKKAVDRFNGGVPNVYPVDLFEHIWVVDRLQRLGICRYFKEEIEECMDYIHRYWTGKGICWARNSWISDLDDTAMGFRLLRQHGYQVSPDVFEHFKNGSAFCTFKGQSTEAVTGMFNLYRASQLKFPGEKILDDAKKYSVEFLREKRAANELLDKWIITKDLPGEVGYALDVPWYASLPRVETRFYLEHYGGDDDVWIGKTLYRMPYVNNNKYLDLAKLDYNNCQALYLSELDHVQRWYSQSEIGHFGISSKALLVAYFVAASSICEPERSRERIAWAKTSILVEIIASFFNSETTSATQRSAFVREFKSTARSWEYSNGRRWVPNKVGQGLIGTLLGTLNQLSLDRLVAHGRDIYSPLRDAWEKWLVSWEEEGDKYKGLAELLVQTINLGGGRCTSEKPLLSPQPYQRLSDLSNRLCHHLARQSFCPEDQVKEINGSCNGYGHGTTIQVEPAMQDLVELVFGNTADELDKEIKKTFFTVVRSFYYTTFCDSVTIDFHISKVLFERVI